MKQYQLYILDFDGTLINSYEGLKIFYKEVFGHFGYEITDKECYDFSKMSLQKAFQIKINDESLMKEFADVAYALVETGILLEHNIPYEDALNFLHYIKDNNLPLVIVTGNSIKHVNKVLNYWDLSTYPSQIICSEDLTHQKPNPEGIKLAMKKMGYEGELEDVCYVGDAYNDYLAAKSAGVTPILVDRFNEYKNDADYLRILNLEELFN